MEEYLPYIITGIAIAFTNFLIRKAENYYTKNKSNLTKRIIKIFSIIWRFGVPFALIIFVTVILELSKLYVLIVIIMSTLIIIEYIIDSFIRPLTEVTKQNSKLFGDFLDSYKETFVNKEE